MRLLSDYNRLLLVTLAAGCLSCSSAPPGHIESDQAVFEGEVAVEESNPFDRKIFLMTLDGKSWKLDPKKAEGELSRLAGHSIRVTGTISSDSDDESKIIVERYIMMPVDGMVPVIGVVDSGGGKVILRTGKHGFDFSLTGPLEGAISTFDGLTAWVWGESAEEPAPQDSGRDNVNLQLRRIEVKGYVILGSSRGSDPY